VTLTAGTRLGPYEILAPLGAGGMGEVYRARDSRLNREVAIKVPPQHLAQNPAALARFEREAKAVAALSHPNILDIHDFGSDGGVSFAVTELLKGETLRHRLASGPLPWRGAARMARALADGLTAAHSRGVIHRDLKPENIFLTEDERVKILDFGLARLEPEPPPEGAASLPTATETGTILGTVGYMSPEQVRGEKADARSDIFSLGCVLYEMITGRHAFAAGSVPETLVSILREEPEDPAALVPDLPEALGLILGHCLAKSPNDRFQSARDLALALDDVAGVASGPVRFRDRRNARRKTLAVARVALILVAALAAAAGVRSLLAARSAIDSLAVLPFANATGDPAAEYLGDGVSESLMNALSRFASLRVLARTPVSRFKGEPDGLKAGRALGARSVLTGKVARRGDHLVVTVELLDVRRGAHLWGERYDRTAADLQHVEEEIARQVSRKLGLTLSRQQEERLSRPSTSSAEAYDLYMQGRFAFNKRTPEGLQKSLELFTQAARLDPEFGLAYVGLADAYDLIAFYGAAPPRDILPKQRDAAIRALEIDESNAEAHASLADIRYQFERDWAGAERDFRRAIALNPNYARAHQWYSNFLSAAGRFEQSFEEIRTARRLDPEDLMIRCDEGQAQFFAGNQAQAIALFRRLIEIEPSFPLAHLYLGVAALAGGDPASAIAEAKTAMSQMEGEPEPIVLYGHACAKGGRPEEARRALAQLEELSAKRFVDGFAAAFLYVGMGEKQKALAALERAYEERSGRLVYLKVMRAFDPLRTEPRFRDLVLRLQIP
jgi:eukaryotic-like serine/threonine-protein kinase